MVAGRIFVCYRREDSAGHAGRLYDRLNQRFPDRVFMDVVGISVGTRWAEVIERTLGSCKVAIVLIGKRWLERSPEGTRRIDQPHDSTRAEIVTAAQEVSSPAWRPPVERAVPPPGEPQMGGDFALVSFAEGGISMPASGAMRLIPVRPGVIQFDTFVVVAGGSYRYIGYFQGGGTTWIATTTQSNDSRALTGSLAFHITFDGSTLTTRNPYGQLTVWRKQ